MKFADKWWSCPAEAHDGKTIIVTGRDGIDNVRLSGKFIYRIDINWDYNALPDGMPDEADAELMGEVHDALLATFDRDRSAVMTSVYTGDGRRTWVFYTCSLRIFGSVLNRALEELPTVPIVIEASEDPDWEEYLHTREETFIPDED